MHLLNTLPQRLDPGATPTFAGLIAPSLTSPAASPLTLGTTDSGAAITVLSASNNVGIGTTTPAQKLQVGSTADATNNFIRIATDSSRSQGISFLRSGSIETVLAVVAQKLQYAINPASNADADLVAASKFTIDNAGNVGIGTVSPTAKLHAYSGASGVSPVTGSIGVMESNGNAYFSILGPTADAKGVFFGSPTSQITAGIVYNYDAVNALSLRAAGATRLRISDTGDVSIFSSTAGSAGAGALVVTGGLATGGASYFGGAVSVTGIVTATSNITTSGTLFSNFANSFGAFGLELKDTTDTSNATFAAFKKSNGTAIGSISRVTTTDAVAYNTTSDGRLKTNVRDFTAKDSGRIIDGLKPRWFDWKNSDDNGKNIIGFIAQEEALVDPALARIGAVTAGDDDPETVIKQWAVDSGKLVPILVAELQSLRARLAALEAK